MARRPKKPKDNLTTEQRAAMRAVERSQKPPLSGRLAEGTPQVSKLAHLADRRPRGPQPCQRIRSLPIIDEVVTCIKRGWPDIEVARFIHTEGHLTEVPEDNLRREVRRYRTRVLKPFEVAEEHLSEGTMQAIHEVRHGLDELQAIDKNVKKHEAVLDRVYKAIMVMTSPAEPAPQGAAEGATDKPQPAAQARAPVDVPPKYREAEGLPDELARAYLMAGNFPFKQLTKAMDEISKSALRSAQIKALLGITEMSNPMVREEREQAQDEETIVAYSRRRFVGRADAQRVLQDPESRAKITTLFQRAMTDGLLHRDMEAGLDGQDTIEVEAEPAEPEEPSDGPTEADPAPKVG